MNCNVSFIYCCPPGWYVCKFAFNVKDTNFSVLQFFPESNGYDSVCDTIAFHANSSPINSSTVLIEWEVIEECVRNGSNNFIVYRVFYMKMSNNSEYVSSQECGESGWQVWKILIQ